MHYTVLQEVSSHYDMAISCYTTKSSSNNQTLNPSLLEFYTFSLASVPFSLNPSFWHVCALLVCLRILHHLQYIPSEKIRHCLYRYITSISGRLTK